MCRECFPFFPFFLVVDEKVKESERKVVTQSFRAFTLVNFAFSFFHKSLFFVFLSLYFFLQYDIIDSLASLCVIIKNSPLFNVSHRAKKNIDGSQKQHFHLPPLFPFYFLFYEQTFISSLYYCCRRLRV